MRRIYEFKISPILYQYSSRVTEENSNIWYKKKNSYKIISTFFPTDPTIAHIPETTPETSKLLNQATYFGPLK